MYAGYDFYTNEFHGSAIEEADFPRLAMFASQYIDAATMGRARRYKKDDAVKMAMCAVAEVFLDEENLNAAAYSQDALLASMTSETVGSWHKSSATANISAADTQNMEKRKYDRLLLFLLGTGLLNCRAEYAPPRRPVVSRR